MLVAHQFGHAAAAPDVHGTLKLLDEAGIRGELVLRELRTGRVETVQMWGRARVRAAGVPPHPRAVAALSRRRRRRPARSRTPGRRRAARRGSRTRRPSAPTLEHVAAQPAEPARAGGERGVDRVELRGERRGRAAARRRPSPPPRSPGRSAPRRSRAAARGSSRGLGASSSSVLARHGEHELGVGRRAELVDAELPDAGRCARSATPSTFQNAVAAATRPPSSALTAWKPIVTVRPRRDRRRRRRRSSAAPRRRTGAR